MYRHHTSKSKSFKCSCGCQRFSTIKKLPDDQFRIRCANCGKLEDISLQKLRGFAKGRYNNKNVETLQDFSK